MCFQVPAYIITLHDLLALTPHDHVERNTLEYAQSVLEDLSTVSLSRLCFVVCFSNTLIYFTLLNINIQKW